MNESAGFLSSVLYFKKNEQFGDYLYQYIEMCFFSYTIA